jgi:hypothetical protein
MKFISDSTRKQIVANISLMVFLIFAIFLVRVFPPQSQKTLYYFCITGILISAFFCMGFGFRKNLRWFVIVAIIMLWSYFITDNNVVNVVSKSLNIYIFFAIALLLVKQVASSKSVNRIMILEAVNGYMMIAMFYSIIIGLVMFYDPGAFNFHGSISKQSDQVLYNFNEYLYYGFNAFASVTYGDVMPVSPLAKSISMALSFTGQMYVAIIISMLVGKYISNEQDK